MSSDWRDLENGLAGLGGDVAGAELPGPDAARARARQRTRRRTASVTLAAAAVVLAGGGIAVGQLAGNDATEVPPAGRSDDSPTPTPTPPPTPEALSEIPESALMEAGDILVYDDSAAWNAAPPNTGPDLECVPTLEDVTSTDHKWIEFDTPASVSTEGESVGRGPDDPRIRQDIVLLEPGAATEVFNELKEQIKECAPPREDSELPEGSWSMDDSAVQNVGDDAWVFRYWDRLTPTDAMLDVLGAEARASVTVGLVREGDVLNIIVRSHFTLEENFPPDYLTPAKTAERMCVEIFAESCVDGDPAAPELGEYPFDVEGNPIDPESDPEREPTDEPTNDPTDDPTGGPSDPDPDLHELAEDPLLTDDDVNPVGTYDGFVRSASTGPSGELYELLCLGPFLAADFEGSATGVWSHKGEGGYTEVARQVADDQSGLDLFGQHETLPDECGEVSDTHEQTVNQPEPILVDGASAMAWTVTTEPTADDLGSEPFFGGVGMARNANIIVVITFTASGDPTEGEWNDYATRTLATALGGAIAE